MNKTTTTTTTCKIKRLLVNFCQNGKDCLLNSWYGVFRTDQKCPYLHANNKKLAFSYG